MNRKTVKSISNNDKSIMFVTVSMAGGGTERVIATLANYWIKKEYAVSILMIAGDTVAYELDSRIEVKCISKATKGSIQGRLTRLSAMRTEFKQSKATVVIAMGTIASMFSSLALIGLKNRLIVSERNNPDVLNHRPIKGHERMVRNLLYTRAHRVVFQTDMAMERFPNSIVRKGVVIMNPLREDILEPSDISKREKIVVTAGRLTEQKNHRLLMDAFIEFHKEYLDYTLSIFGEGELKDTLEQYIVEKEARDYISLQGFSKDIHKEMNRSVIYVSSSDWEGISNSLMEAMAMGMGTIATDCPMGGSAMLINDGVNGRLVSVGDRDGLVTALTEMADSKLLCGYSLEAKKVRELYSVDSIAKQWEGIM